LDNGCRAKHQSPGKAGGDKRISEDAVPIKHFVSDSFLCQSDGERHQDDDESTYFFHNFLRFLTGGSHLFFVFVG
jgi:hypothetical protein